MGSDESLCESFYIVVGLSTGWAERLLIRRRTFSAPNSADFDVCAKTLIDVHACYWAHSMGPQRSPLTRVVVGVVVDIYAQAACDSNDTW